MPHFLRFAQIVLVLLVAPALVAHAQLRLDLESGLVVGTNYNEIRIPNTGGTRVDLARSLAVKPTIFYRIRMGYTIAGRHTISALYAPLTVRYAGSFSQAVNYNNVIFPAVRPLTVDYTFNSYRLTYRYEFIRRDRWRVGAGLTAKIRDASVQFSNESQQTNFDNLGLVPLLNVSVAYRPTARWTILLEGDALGSRFGRAEDVFAGTSWQLTKAVGLKAGYRVVEGGANVESIYNFTWINYASVGILINI